MKKLIQISTLFTILLCLNTMSVSATCIWQPEDGITHNDNFLDLKGDIVNYKADIEVFEYVDSIEGWVSVKEYSNKSRYSIRLNPTKNYQIWFTNVEMGMKILHVDAGHPGPWSKYIDIDFESEGTYAHIFQDTKSYDYVFELCNSTYSSIQSNTVSTSQVFNRRE